MTKTYKVEFLGNEQLDFPLGIYTAGKKGKTGIIWRRHYKRENKLNSSSMTWLKDTVNEMEECSSWVTPDFIKSFPTTYTTEIKTGKSLMQKNKPFSSLPHPLGNW